MLDISAQFQHVYIVGDFNEDVSITSNTCCCTMLRLQGFQQMISKPTHCRGTLCHPLWRGGFSCTGPTAVDRDKGIN